MAFGSGNQNQQQSSKPPHHRHHHQQSSSGGGGGGPPHPPHQQSSTTAQKCNLPLGSSGSGGAPPPNLPPKTGSGVGYFSSQSQGGSEQHHHHQSHHHPHSHHHHPHQQQMFFQGGGGGGSVSSSSVRSGGKTQQQSSSAYQQHHHHHHGGGVGFSSSEGMVVDNERLASLGGGGGQQHSVTSTSSTNMSQQQQQYNQNQPFGDGQHHNNNNNQQQQSRDLTDHERLLLDQIRAKKASLLKEIAQLQDEIDCVSKELIFSHKEPDQPPPPDLIQGQQQHPHPHQPPLADIELDNLSEHSNGDEENNAPGGLPRSGKTVAAVLGSNNSSNSSSSNSKERDRLKLMSLGCKKFNMDPKKGIEFLVENGLLKKEDELDLGMFLYRGEGLNKTAIGDYLGERSEFNERVLKCFVGLHDFTDLILVQALRQFLWSFRLPGEAQKIDRMMECFAQRYCQNNPDIFTNTDTCYVLSFAIIMLNTSLHNPSVKDKPTVEQFISMNRGINNGGDLPRELLISLYNSIQSEPFKIPEDDGNDLMTTFFNPDKEGWLWKQGGRYKTWKRRWFILNDNCLYYFEFTTYKEPRGIIPLENVNVREIDDGGREKSKQRYCFELYATDRSEVIKACKTDSDGRVVEGKHSVYRMSAASKEERDSWVKALRQSISYSPFYEILRKSGGGGNSSSSLRGGGAGGGSRLRSE